MEEVTRLVSQYSGTKHCEIYTVMPVVNMLKRIVKDLLDKFGTWRFQQALAAGKLNGKLLILMYHRVLPKSDPRLKNEEPGMYVTPETLDMHLNELKEIATLIDIENWLELSHANKLKNTPYCAITFDDGWADNYEFAMPLLKKHAAPATIFLATDYIDSTATFWPERLASLLNNVDINSEALNTFFSELGVKLDHARLKQLDKDYIAQLIDHAKQLSDDEIKSWLDHIENNQIPKKAKPEMLSWDQVRELQTAGIKIGGHTRSHLRLNKQASNERIENEIAGCSDDIKAALGQKPTVFCYPNGDTSNQAVRAVKTHFKAAVTTQRGINSTNQSAYLLNRIGVHEDASASTTQFKAILCKALS